MKTTVFEVLTLSCCCYGLLAIDRASGENAIQGEQGISLAFRATNNLLHHRVKRGGGGGGFIPFRPLFVYRQQQREQQEKWKEIEAKKKLKEQYQDAIIQNQLYDSHRPATPAISYSQPATSQYTSYNYYPYTRYTSYSPSYYNRYEYQNDPYANYYQKYYQKYYDGYNYDGYDYDYSYF